MTTQSRTTPEEAPDGPSDPELISAVRAGDTDAFTTLYGRHHQAATRRARTLTNTDTDTDTLVDEAFTHVLTTLQAGEGPDLALRPYLHTTIRDTHTSTEPPTDTSTATATSTSTHTSTATDDDSRPTLATQAFHTLPERWQLVLWHTDVEAEDPTTIAPLLGLTPNGVTALAYRARERLRHAYLRAHAADSPVPSECAALAPLFAAEFRGDLSTQDQEKLTGHLADCPSCPDRHAELADLEADLAAFIAPGVLGETWATYLGRPAGGARRGHRLLAAVVAWPGSAVTAVRGAVRRAAGAVRGALRKVGARNTAIGAGAAAAVAAAAIAAIVLSPDATPSTPQPEAPAAGPEAPGSAPGAPTGSPVDPSASAGQPETAPSGGSPGRRSGAPGDGPSTKPGASSRPPLLPSPPVVIPTLRPSLSSGKSGEVAVSVEYRGARRSGGAADTSDADTMTLDVRLPHGVRLTSSRAGDGWQCGSTGDGVRCTRTAIAPGQSTTAEVQLHVDKDVAGEHEITATAVLDGERATRTDQVMIDG